MIEGYKGIKGIVSLVRSWECGYVKIYYDDSDCTIWGDFHYNQSDYKVYNSKSIHYLTTYKCGYHMSSIKEIKNGLYNDILNRKLSENYTYFG